jgi:hypothetical protein
MNEGIIEYLVALHFWVLFNDSDNYTFLGQAEVNVVFLEKQYALDHLGIY